MGNTKFYFIKILLFYRHPNLPLSLQSELIEKIINLQPEIQNVLDPFIRSGTTM